MWRESCQNITDCEEVKVLKEGFVCERERVKMSLPVKQLLLVILIIVGMDARYNDSLCRRWNSDCRKFNEHCNTTATRGIPPNITTPLVSNISSNSSSPSCVSNINNSHAIKVWKSCCDLSKSVSNASSGIYTIQSSVGLFNEMWVYCDTKENQGGWMVIMRRINGMLSFDRSWKEYENGFGNLSGEFWYGLSKVHSFTKLGDWELQVNLITTENEKLTANYSKFRVKGWDNYYTLDVEGHSGVTDFLTQFSTRNFTTYDENYNPKSGQQNCGTINQAGWWYTDHCLADKGFNLNHPFRNGKLDWKIDSETTFYIREIEMKIRQKNCLQGNISSQSRRNSIPQS